MSNLYTLAVKAFVLTAMVVSAAVITVSSASADTTLINGQVPLATPTSGWLVGPSSLAQEQGASNSCLLMNQFDDSSVIRFAGNKEGLLALATDFRTKAFNPGDVHLVTLRLGDVFEAELQGRAFSESVLLVNLSKAQDIYSALGRASILQISLSGKDFDYALLGISDGLNRFDDCTGGVDNGLQRQSFQPDVRPPAMTEQTPSVAAPVYRSTSSPQATMPMADKALTPLPRVSTASASASTSGDVLASINQAETAIRPYNQLNQAQINAAPATAPVATPVRSPKKSRSSAAQIQNAAPRDILVNLPASQAADVSRLEQGNASSATAAADMERRWRAIKGSNLREVLDVWTRGANVDLLWQAEQEYPVKTSVIFQGNFESAVMGLLSQYNGDDKVRPTGRLFNDPILGGKVLLIKSKNDD